MNPKPSRYLIVNADDCNLTAGVTEAILQAHRKGIVSSTTFLVNLPVRKHEIDELLHEPVLGIGIHLNISLGAPVSRDKDVSSLVENGRFRKKSSLLEHPPFMAEIFHEYDRQVQRFCELFGRLPTHLDTHHHLHDHPAFFQAFEKTALKYMLPVRKSRQVNGNLRSTGFFFGSLDPEGHWRMQPLREQIRNLPAGVSEIMCHPGKADEALAEISSFTRGREEEFLVFSDNSLRGFLKDRGIELIHYGSRAAL